MKISKDCIDEALRALKDFSADELKEYVNDVFEKAKSYKNMSNARAFDAAMKEINDERLKSYFESTMTAANNAMKVEHMAERIKDGKATLKNMSIKRYENVGDNIVSAQVAAREQLETVVFDKVTREETAFLSSGDNDLLIASAYDGKKVESQEAKLWATIWKDVYFPQRNADLIMSNAMPFNHINEDRWFRNIHDSSKIILGGNSAIDLAKTKGKFNPNPAKKRWVEWIDKHFDLIHSNAVKGTAEYDEILSGMYDGITTGESDIFTRSVIVNDRIAVQNKSRRRLQPKSMTDFVLYNREYGRGNLFDAMLMDIRGSANKIGMARTLGDSPHVAYAHLRKVQQEKDPSLKELWYRNADLYFKEAMRENSVAADPTLAAFDSNIRSVTAMARLASVTFQSLPDINNRAVFAMNHGYNYFSAWGEHLKGLFDLLPQEDHKYLARTYRTLFRDHMGYMGKVQDAQNSSQILNKISTGYFKLNLLNNFDKGGKLVGMKLVAKGIGRYSNKRYENVPLAAKHWISRFLEPREWDFLRSKTQQGMFTVDNVMALSDKEIKEFYNAGNQTRPLHEVRNDLYRKVHAMSQIASENMILNPGEFERAFILRGTKPGTPEGVFLRQVTQFKMFTFSSIDKNLIQGYKTADATQQKLAWATATFIGSIPLAFGMMFFNNLLQGKTMPDITRMNVGEAEKFLLELIQPSLFLFAGMLDPKHQNSDMVLSLLGSPSIRMLGNALATAASLATGDPKAALKHFTDTMKYVLPIQNTPIISPLIREVMGEKGHLEPGQKHLFGR
jgi:hypothetical protein